MIRAAPGAVLPARVKDMASETSEESEVTLSASDSDDDRCVLCFACALGHAVVWRDHKLGTGITVIVANSE